MSSHINVIPHKLNASILPYFQFFVLTLQPQSDFGRWCNGNTTGFGSVIPGSNPSRPTEKTVIRQSFFVGFRDESG